MKSEPHITKAKAQKIEGMKKIRAAYLEAQRKGELKSHRIKIELNKAL